MEVNPIALRKAKIACNFGLSQCSRVKHHITIKIEKIGTPC